MYESVYYYVWKLSIQKKYELVEFLNTAVIIYSRVGSLNPQNIYHMFIGQM